MMILKAGLHGIIWVQLQQVLIQRLSFKTWQPLRLIAKVPLLPQLLHPLRRLDRNAFELECSASGKRSNVTLQQVD